MAQKQLLMIPGPTNVPERVMQALAKPIINHRGPEFHEFYAGLIEKAKRIFQTKGDVFVLSCSGTGGVECALSNVISPGDEVLVPVNGVFSQRLKQKVERLGGGVVEVKAELGKAATPEQIEAAAEGRKLRAIAVVYNETSTGATARGLKEVGEIARARGALFLVDAISILGGDELPVDEWGVDLCITGSQKCLACPPGLALVSVSERAWRVIEQAQRRAYYFDLLEMREFQKRLETPFTPALPLYFALDAALELIEEEGLKARIRRHRECARAFYSGLEGLGLEPFAAKPWRSNTVISIKNPPGVEGRELRELMREKYGVVIAGGMGELKEKILRIGNMGIINQSLVSRTLEALKGALRELRG